MTEVTLTVTTTFSVLCFPGPGPGVYMLPPTVGYEKHDITRLRFPAYSMGERIPIKGEYNKIGPGPRYNIEKNYTRYGKNGIPAYTIRTPLKPTTKFCTPGPGTYAPEKCPLMKENRAPAYTMTPRTIFRKSDTTPGPNQYKLPQYLGPNLPDKHASAAYTIGKIPRQYPGYRTPGPAQYDPTDLNKYKYKLPQYTMLERRSIPGDRTSKPGPAAYFPGYLPGPNPPKFSFGLRRSPFMEPLILENDN